MRRVVQKDWFGCGIACVAMVGGVTYEKAKMTMFNKVERKHLRTGDLDYTTTVRLVRGLRRLGIRCGDRLVPLRGRSYRSLKCNAVLKAWEKKAQRGGDFHWVVWDAKRRRFLDPGRLTYRRLRVRQYVKIAG